MNTEFTKAGASTAPSGSGSREGTHWDSHKWVEVPSFSSSSVLCLFKVLAKLQCGGASNPMSAELSRGDGFVPRAGTSVTEGGATSDNCDLKVMGSWLPAKSAARENGPAGVTAVRVRIELAIELLHCFHLFVGISVKLSSHLCQFSNLLNLCYILKFALSTKPSNLFSVLSMTLFGFVHSENIHT